MRFSSQIKDRIALRVLPISEYFEGSFDLNLLYDLGRFWNKIGNSFSIFFI